MDKSDSIKELASALAKAQGQIGGAAKDSTNPFFKTKYADLSSVVDAIKLPLSENGLSYVQISHDSQSSASIETVILHSSGEWLSTGTITVPVNKADAQGYGSAITYARRYSLQMAFGVAPDDDDGNGAAKAKLKAKPEPSKPDPRLGEFAIKVASVTSIDALNGLIEEAKAMGKPTSIQAWDILKKQATSDGLVFDKESSKFIIPQVTEAF